MLLCEVKPLSRRLIASHAVAGIAEITIMQAAAAVGFFPGSHEAFKGLDFHEVGALHHKTMSTKPPQQYG